MTTPLRVLIAEDDPLDAELLVRQLKRAGYAPVWERVDSEDEFRLALTPEIELVLSDFTMPGFNGFRALKIVRDMSASLPFILVSANIGEDLAVQAIKRGANDYLLKDRMERLGAAVKQALEQTEMVRARHHAEDKLRASEAQFRQLAANIDQVFWITDPNKSELVYVSPAYEVVWGRTCESLYANPTDWYDAVHPEDRPRVLPVLARQGMASTEQTYRVIRGDGDIRWIHDRSFTVRNAQGEVDRIVGVAHDVTERRRLEEQLLQAQKLESLGQLAGGVAHDFNNLLSVILVNGNVLLEEAPLSEDHRELLTEITSAGDRAAALTRQLLLFSRRHAVVMSEVDLKSTVAGLTRMLSRVLGEDITIKSSFSTTAVLVHADAGMLEQVVFNLAVNARDAMPRGGVLEFAVDEHEGMARLRVSDSGTGIPPAIRARIFDPFFTTKEVGKGTGLGLATVYGIVQQHTGRIELESEVGKGTTFTILLPRIAATAPQPPKVITPEARTHGKGEVILFVEDDPAVRTICVKVLERLGYRVIQAPTGADALNEWRAHAPEIQLLITDVVMPGGMSGDELAELLLAERPGLPVIYTSGYAPKFAEKHAQDGTNFLPKPFRPEELSRLVGTVLGA